MQLKDQFDESLYRGGGQISDYRVSSLVQYGTIN